MCYCSNIRVLRKAYYLKKYIRYIRCSDTLNSYAELTLHNYSRGIEIANAINGPHPRTPCRTRIPRPTLPAQQTDHKSINSQKEII